MEPGDGVHEDFSGLQALLCGADGEAFAGDGVFELCEWIRVDLAGAVAGVASAVEEAAGDLRELDERPIPQEGAAVFCAAGFQRDAARTLARVSGVDEACRPAGAAVARAGLGAECVDGGERGECAVCVAHRPPAGHGRGGEIPVD